MTVQGNYQVQGMIEQAPKGFNWAMFPPLKGTSQNQAANPQTLSISQQSKHKAEAMQFIAYALNTQNMATLAQGDWLIPVAQPARRRIGKQTGGRTAGDGSRPARSSKVALPFQSTVNYPRWKDEIATPAFQQYLAEQEDLDT